jgi:hypothetical protein
MGAAMTWRDKYKVHPAADVFPMMSDAEIAELGEDIKANGLMVPLLFSSQGEDHVLLDGRNRLEAMERVGITIETDRFGLPDRYRGAKAAKSTHTANPVAYIIGLNIRRRHLTKQQQADLIVAAHKAAEDKPRQVGEVSNGGRGKVNETKAAIVSTAAEHGISKRTVERAMARAEGRKPAKKTKPSCTTRDEDGTETPFDFGKVEFLATACGRLEMVRTPDGVTIWGADIPERLKAARELYGTLYAALVHCDAGEAEQEAFAEFVQGKLRGWGDKRLPSPPSAPLLDGVSR